jgi:hypothetical protein
MLFQISIVFALCALFIPPILAFRGKAFRGFWVIGIVIGAIVAFFGSGMNEYMLEKRGMSAVKSGYSGEVVVRTHQPFDILITPFTSLAIGSYLAVCLFRPKQE